MGSSLRKDPVRMNHGSTIELSNSCVKSTGHESDENKLLRFRKCVDQGHAYESRSVARRAPKPKAETTSHRFTCPTMSAVPRPVRRRPRPSKGPQRSSRCAITHLPAHAPVKEQLSTPGYTSTQDALRHMWRSDWLFCS